MDPNFFGHLGKEIATMVAEMNHGSRNKTQWPSFLEGILGQVSPC